LLQTFPTILHDVAEPCLGDQGGIHESWVPVRKREEMKEKKRVERN
jgi:hypothetical protein